MLAELLRPALRIFLSVDVEDSTSFKQQADEADPRPWRDYFVAFLRDFPGDFDRHRARLGAVRAKPWKLLGDEIVFSAELAKPSEVAGLLLAFRDTLAEYRLSVQKPRKLRLKGSAWVAEFPVANAVVPVELESGNQFDYIGPSMDTGFRLGKIATPRKLSLSVELAWLLLQLPARARRDLPLCCEGRCELKGVMTREGYPWIWTDVFHRAKPALVSAEDELLPLPLASAPVLKRFCEYYLREHGEPRRLPFIPGVFEPRTEAEKKMHQAEFQRIEDATRRLWPEPEIVAAADSTWPTGSAQTKAIL